MIKNTRKNNATNSTSRSFLLKLAGLIVISATLFSCMEEDEPSSKVEDKATVQDKAIVQDKPSEIDLLRETALKSDLGYQILESLTTEVGARMAGTPQDTLAVNWAVAKFEALGFDKVWKEPVTFDTWARGGESAEIITPYPQSLHITALGGSIGTSEAGIKATLIHFETLDALKSAESAEVEGKIVFISNRMERFRDGRGYGEAVAARSTGAIEASKKGAVAVIIRSVGTDSHRLPHTGMMKYEEGITKVPAAALSNPDADQLVRIFERYAEPTIKLNIGAHASGSFTSHNVIGEITGKTNPEQLVIIGGHLDSWDLGTGAVDDGAGVAITMAAARIIKDSGLKLNRTIRVILWANEEQGLIGAKAYAKANKANIANHIIGAESDFGAGKIYEFSSLFSQEDMPFVEELKEAFKPLGIEYGNNEAGPGPDLVPLYQNGMSVFRLAQDGSDYFDLHHTADDTLDKVEPESLAQNVAAYAVFAAMMANYPGDLKRPKKEEKNEH